MVVSCLADYAGGEVKLEDSMVDSRWVNLEEAKSVDLIEGIYEELAMAEKMLKSEERGEWAKE